MGLADRDYERSYESRGHGGPPGLNLAGPRSMTTNLLLLMVGVYVVQIITRGPMPQNGWFTELFLLEFDFWRQPWTAFQLVTYGFLHDPYHLTHIIFNGFGLWIFGSWVEERYGSKELLALFLVGVMVAGLCWSIAELVNQSEVARMLGASGGISALMAVGILCFPHRTLLLWFVLPIPAWLLGVIWLLGDVWGAIDRSGDVAYTAHLGGALFGLIYYRSGWRLASFWPAGGSWPKIRMPRRHNLRVHNPGDPDDDSEVDDILRKIQRSGQESLTLRERRILERASRQYQQKRR
jgi:membrane associated rhomboid family serine protease